MTTTLTIKPQYAALIVAGHKRYETRTWKPKTLPDVLAIHAGKAKPAWGSLAGQGIAAALGITSVDQLSYGAVLGLVRVVEVLPIGDILTPEMEAERQWGYYTPGGYAWKLEVIEKFERPVPATGRLGLWKWEV